LAIARSTVAYPGPLTLFLGALPNVYASGRATAQLGVGLCPVAGEPDRLAVLLERLRPDDPERPE
jgi:hypothetical protein